MREIIKIDNKPKKEKKAPIPCLFPECNNKKKSKGLCAWHWKIAKELISEGKVELEILYKHGRAIESKVGGASSRTAEDREKAITWFLMANKLDFKGK